MALAYTNLPTAYEQIPATPALDFLAALDALLLEVGWEHLTPYANGWEYLLESPQELQARCRIWFPTPADAGFSNCFALQFLSHADPAKAGHVHHFQAGYPVFLDWGFTDIAVWANCCQIFIGAVNPLPGVAGGDNPRAVSGGIPYAYGATEPTCDLPAPPEMTTELWWTCGDERTGTAYPAYPYDGPAQNFRNSYFAARYSFCRNGVLKNRIVTEALAPLFEAELLQLAILRSAYYWNWSEFPDGFVRLDDTPLANDPLMIESRTIYGELWDAVLVSRPMALEAAEQIYESDKNRTTTWVNYTKGLGLFIAGVRFRNEGACYSLLLLIDRDEPGTGEDVPVNVAY